MDAFLNTPRAEQTYKELSSRIKVHLKEELEVVRREEMSKTFKPGGGRPEGGGGLQSALAGVGGEDFQPSASAKKRAKQDAKVQALAAQLAEQAGVGSSQLTAQNLAALAAKGGGKGGGSTKGGGFVKKKVCYKFLDGKCEHSADKCSFAHDKSLPDTRSPGSKGNTPPGSTSSKSSNRSLTTDDGTKICHFHKPWKTPAATCRNGAQCKFAHVNEQPMAKGGVARMRGMAAATLALIAATVKGCGFAAPATAVSDFNLNAIANYNFDFFNDNSHEQRCSAMPVTFCDEVDEICYVTAKGSKFGKVK